MGTETKVVTLAAFDIGQSTGVAIAEVRLNQKIKLDLHYCGSFTWVGQPLFDPVMFTDLFSNLDEVWAEYPKPNNFSSGIQLTLDIANQWRVLLDGLSIPVREVLPGTWKTSLASKFELQSVLPVYRLHPGNELTQHEKDAFGILAWRGLRLRREYFGS